VTDLLVVAGEASGDRAAAGVVGKLAGVRAFGVGGPALAATGADLLGDLREMTALGIGEPAARAVRIANAFRRVAHEAKKREPRASLLVNYTEFNARLAPRLRARGVRVLWYVAPQIWAWRASRADDLRRAIDRMAVILPFEEALWRARGVDARYVGHPARETTCLDRDTARRALGMTARAAAVAILPGSRPHEVRRLLAPMLDAYERVRRDRASVDGRLLLAASLDARTRAYAIALANKMHVDVFDVDPHVGAIGVLAAFDVALCASGTAALEAALARAVPIVAYRVGVATEIAARLLLRSEHIALPNVLLGRRAFDELLQRDVQPVKLGKALARALDRRNALLRECAAVDAALGPDASPSREVARMLEPWL
jgi:lipid-A-disaccharide synthase